MQQNLQAVAKQVPSNIPVNRLAKDKLITALSNFKIQLATNNDALFLPKIYAA